MTLIGVVGVVTIAALVALLGLAVGLVLAMLRVRELRRRIEAARAERDRS